MDDSQDTGNVEEPERAEPASAEVKPAKSEAVKDKTTSERPATVRELLVGGAHLGALWAFAFVQPLLDLLGNNPDFFVARDNTSSDIVIFAVVFTFLPPLILLAIEAIVRLINKTAYRWLHLGFIAVLAAVFFVQIEKRIFQNPTILILLLALALGGLLAYGLYKTKFVRSLLDVLSVAPFVVVVIFLFFSSTSKLVLPQDQASALGVKIPSKTPVVMVIFDEFPSATLMNAKDQIDAKRFPGFASLKKQTTWYRNNTTVADFTGRAVPAILTGTPPTGAELPIASEQPNNLFTLLGGSYKLHVKEVVTQLCPSSLCGGETAANAQPQKERLRSLAEDLRYVEGRIILPPGLANTLPSVSNTFGNFGNNSGGSSDTKKAGVFVRDIFTPPTRAELETWIDDIPPGGRTLSLMHMEVPHEPFRFLPSGQNYQETPVSYLNTPSAQDWATGAAGIASIEQRHYLQSGYADTLVRLVTKRLKKIGLWDKAMVIFTADHGISFKPGVHRRIAEPNNLGGVANPPLFIKYPGQKKGEVSEVHTRTIDILPTIAQQLGIKDYFPTAGHPIDQDTTGGDIEIQNGQGKMIKAPLSAMISQRAQVIKTSGQWLGVGGLNDLGPATRLLGRRVPSAAGASGSTAATLKAGSATATLTSPEVYDNVDLTSDRVPTYVTGNLDGVVQGSLIAIAVNGKVAATGKAFTYQGKSWFGAVVPITSMTNGANKIGVYSVGPGDSFALLGGN